MRKCAKCGARNDAQAVVCSLCNERLGGAYQAESYEPRMFTQGKGAVRRGPPTDPNATRDEPPPGKPPTGEHRLPSAAALEGNVNATRHFLVPPFGELVPLDATRPSVVFGREETCDFKLASTKVSRRHAEILFSKAEKAYIRDLGSQNGTFINDDKLTAERALEDGDSLRMGDFAVTYRKLAAGEDVAKLTVGGNKTAVMETQLDVAMEDVALTGDISILPIVEVLRRLGSLRAHGTLGVDVSGMKGWITLTDGKPADGNYAGLEGAPAIAAMSSLGKGHFNFVADPNAPKPSPGAPAPPTARMSPPTAAMPKPQAPPRPPTPAAPPHAAAPPVAPAAPPTAAPAAAPPKPVTPPPSTARRPGPSGP